MIFSLGRIIIFIVILVIIVLIIKKLPKRSKIEKKQDDAPVRIEAKIQPAKPYKEVSESKILKAIKDHSFVIRPQFEMCGNCVYWQGDREHVKYSKEVKILDDREAAKCSNKDAYHKSPTDKRKCNAGACKYYERW